MPVAVADTLKPSSRSDLTPGGERERLDRQGAFTARRTAASICTPSECRPGRENRRPSPSEVFELVVHRPPIASVTP